MSTLFTQEFILKYTFRFFHIAPVIALAGKIISDYLFGNSVTPTGGSKAFYAISGVLLVIAGFVNTFILKPKDNMGSTKAKAWIGLSHTKLLISILFFTPIVNWFTSNPVGLQFWIVLLFLFLSPFMRFYREHYTKVHKETGGRHGNENETEQTQLTNDQEHIE